MMPLRVQLAIQGGGAKLCGLLAAMQALQKLERDGVIEVTRLAGTSAGSIAAALFAADVDIKTVRALIIAQRKKLAKLFPTPRWLGYAKVLLTGKPIVDISPLRKELDTILRKHGVTLFRDLRKQPKKPLIVVTTDVTNGSAHTLGQDEENVVGAVVDSCAHSVLLSRARSEERRHTARRRRDLREPPRRRPPSHRSARRNHRRHQLQTHSGARDAELTARIRDGTSQCRDGQLRAARATRPW
jgi:predicted acylesterase/phospholipase RssA